MKKVKKSNKKITYIVLFIISLLSIFLFGNQKIKPESVSITSEKLDINIMVPSKYEVNERFTTITIANENGEITVDRYGSFFNDLDDHIKFLSEKNNAKIDIMEKIPSDEYQIYKVKFNHFDSPQPKDITYFISVDYTIYSFQANSEELYSDLDAIAKSFRYNP